MTSPWSSPRSKYIKYVRLDTVGRPARKEAGRPFLYCIGGKPPSYTVGTYQPVMWFSVHTPGGTHRSRPTNHMGSPLVSVGRHLRVPPCGIWAGPPPHRDEPIPPHAPPPGGAEGPKALSPQQCEAWIENPTAPIQSHRTKPLKNLKSQNLKVLLDFFQKIAGVQGAAPPVAGRSQRNPLPPQRAKLPPRARGETGRNSPVLLYMARLFWYDKQYDYKGERNFFLWKSYWM